MLSSLVIHWSSIVHTLPLLLEIESIALCSINIFVLLRLMKPKTLMMLLISSVALRGINVWYGIWGLILRTLINRILISLRERIAHSELSTHLVARDHLQSFLNILILSILDLKSSEILLVTVLISREVLFFNRELLVSGEWLHQIMSRWWLRYIRKVITRDVRVRVPKRHFEFKFRDCWDYLLTSWFIW